jgi:hypothetical protein
LKETLKRLKDPDEQDGIGLKVGPSFGLSNDHPVLDDEARAEFLQPLDELDRAVAVAKEEDDVQTVFRIDHFFGKLELPKIQNCRVILAFGHDAQDDFDSIFLLKKECDQSDKVDFLLGQFLLWKIEILSLQQKVRKFLCWKLENSFINLENIKV